MAKKRSASVEEKALDFAEDLGRLLGTAQQKASTWLEQRTAIANQLAQIRDTANEYLQQLAGEGARMAAAVRKGRKAGRPAGPANTAATAASRGGNRKRKPMSAAARKAVGERMRKYWAARKKAEAK